MISRALTTKKMTITKTARRSMKGFCNHCGKAVKALPQGHRPARCPKHQRAHRAVCRKWASQRRALFRANRQCVQCGNRLAQERAYRNVCQACRAKQRIAKAAGKYICTHGSLIDFCEAQLARLQESLNRRTEPILIARNDEMDSHQIKRETDIAVYR